MDETKLPFGRHVLKLHLNGIPNLSVNDGSQYPKMHRMRFLSPEGGISELTKKNLFVNFANRGVSLTGKDRGITAGRKVPPLSYRPFQARL